MAGEGETPPGDNFPNHKVSNRSKVTPINNNMTAAHNEDNGANKMQRLNNSVRAIEKDT